MPTESSDGSSGFRLTPNMTFAIALVILSLCGVAYVAERYFGWEPPALIRQAIDSVRNR